MYAMARAQHSLGMIYKEFPHGAPLFYECGTTDREIEYYLRISNTGNLSGSAKSCKKIVILDFRS